MNEGVVWYSAVVHWHLHGPAGAEMDVLIATMLASGMSIECVSAGTDYRVENGPRVAALAEQIGGRLEGGFSLAIEEPADGVISVTSKVTPLRPPRRTVHVEGKGEAIPFVARAVDAGLSVTCAGKSRWAISGRSETLMKWLATHVHQTTLDATLKAWGLTPDSLAAEDADAGAPVVKVVLPERRTTTTTIERNAAGDISRVVQLEKDA